MLAGGELFGRPFARRADRGHYDGRLLSRPLPRNTCATPPGAPSAGTGLGHAAGARRSCTTRRSTARLSENSTPAPLDGRGRSRARPDSPVAAARSASSRQPSAVSPPATAAQQAPPGGICRVEQSTRRRPRWRTVHRPVAARCREKSVERIPCHSPSRASGACHADGYIGQPDVGAGARRPRKSRTTEMPGPGPRSPASKSVHHWAPVPRESPPPGAPCHPAAHKARKGANDHVVRPMGLVPPQMLGAATIRASPHREPFRMQSARQPAVRGARQGDGSPRDSPVTVKPTSSLRRSLELVWPPTQGGG